MPAVDSNQLKHVLVTGANGYIALWIVKNLLEQGYNVRGAVRSPSKGANLLDTFKEYPSHRLQFFVVEDMAKEGAFDEAVKSVDAVVHTASPVTVHSDDPEVLIGPAVQGTLGILNSVLKHGTQVKRIVMTSSCSTLQRLARKPTILNENDWADGFIQFVKKAGSRAPFIVKYLVSKTLAERAAWKFYGQHKSEIGWDLVTVLPPYVMGAPLQEFKTPEDLPVSLEYIYTAVCTEQSKEVLEAEISFGYVHVKDAAQAHVQCLKTEAASGQRIIVSSGSTTWQLLRDLLWKQHPDLYASGTLPRGDPNLPSVIMFTYDAKRSKEILGMTYRTIQEIGNDTLDYFKARGWLQEGRFKPVYRSAL